PAQRDGIFRGIASSARIDGGAGDDAIVGPTNGFVQLVGGPGSDVMEGRSVVDTYVFGPATDLERDTVVEPVNPGCDPTYFDTIQPTVSWWTVTWDALDFRSLAPNDGVTVDGNAPDGV